MSYRVILSDEALAELRQFIFYIAKDQSSPQTAERWWHRALAAIETLAEFPHRCPYAPENNGSRHTIRTMMVDRSAFLYRVDEEAQTVRVLRFRHGRQQPPDIK